MLFVDLFPSPPITSCRLIEVNIMDPNPTPLSLYTEISPPATYNTESPDLRTGTSTFSASPIKHEDLDGSPIESGKKRQKRNKPTLSCEECVERKTKVSRFLGCDKDNYIGEA